MKKKLAIYDPVLEPYDVIESFKPQIFSTDKEDEKKAKLMQQLIDWQFDIEPIEVVETNHSLSDKRK